MPRRQARPCSERAAFAGALAASLSWSWAIIGKVIERVTENAARAPMAVARQRLADCFDVGAALERDAAHDGAIARIRVCCAVAFVVVQEYFADSAVGESADRGRVA